MADLQKPKTGSDAIKLTSAKILTMAIGMVSSMLLSRFRTLSEYGTYSQLLMAINLVSSLLMLGLPNCINYFLVRAETQTERDKFLSVYYTLNTILSFLVGLVLVVAIPLLEVFFKNAAIRYFWFFLATYPWTKIVMSSVENLLVVRGKTGKLMVFRCTNSAALLLAILVVQWFNGSFMQYMLLFLAVEAFFTIWVYCIVKHNAESFRFQLDKKLIKTIFAYSIPIGLASMIATIKIEMDKLVITSFMTTEDLAVYTNAAKELPVTIIATSLTAVLMPRVVRFLKEEKTEQAISLWRCATSISFAIISILAIGCFVFAKEVITLLYSEKYVGGTQVFRMYSLLLLCRCTYFGMMLNATGHTKQILYSSIGSLVVNLVLNYVCFSLWGFVGPAVATVLATVAMIIYQLTYSCKILHCKFRHIFPWKTAALYMAENALLGAAFYILHRAIVAHSPMNGEFLAIILGGVWVAVYLLLNFKSLRKQWNILNNS